MRHSTKDITCERNPFYLTLEYITLSFKEKLFLAAFILRILMSLFYLWLVIDMFLWKTTKTYVLYKKYIVVKVRESLISCKRIKPKNVLQNQNKTRIWKSFQAECSLKTNLFRTHRIDSTHRLHVCSWRLVFTFLPTFLR